MSTDKERDKGEFGLIDWIRRCRQRNSAQVSIGLGDDLAGLRLGSEEVLFGCDQVLEGVHFRLSQCGAKAAGRKALARNLSDVAAMAAKPLAAVAAVALPNNMDQEQAREMIQGMWELAEEFDCPVIGGDIASWQAKLAINVSILAVAAGIKPLRRNGARPGDAIMVTGQLGGAILGKHLSFVPLVKEARTLAEAVNVHAMIDISDGLAVDLRHITDESGCGARIFSEDIPISQAARELAKQSGDSALRHSLGDGEDYELLFTMAGDEVGKAQDILTSTGGQLSRIGEITDGAVMLVSADGDEQPLPMEGYEHFKT